MTDIKKKRVRPKIGKYKTKEFKYKIDLTKIQKLYEVGLTDKDISHVLGVSAECVDKWKQAHPEFFESLSAGKKEADKKVVESLYKRALGYEYEELKVIQDRSGKIEKVRQEITKKHVSPDVTACIFWLKNRDRENWADRQEIDNNIKGLSLADLILKAHDEKKSK